MARREYVSNYSIENIAQSIVRDNPTGKKYTREDKRKLYEGRLLLRDESPRLKDILSLEHVHSCDNPWAKTVARVAVIPPEIIVVDSRIQDMCYLPFWVYSGSDESSFGRCACLGGFSSCPPFAPKAEKVQEKLDKADIFFALQTKPSIPHEAEDPGRQFRLLNGLADEVNTLLGKGAVVQKFSGGPCFACFPEFCIGEGKCQAPHLKISSLEAQGVCADQLCKDLAFLTGDEDWKITWIKGFGTPDQRPKRAKGVAGLAITLKPER